MQTALLLFTLALAWTLGAPIAAAETTTSSYKGIWISTPFPDFSASAGETVTLDLSVHNAGLPPQPVRLEIESMPEGWTGIFIGEGKRVESVFVAPDSKANVKFRLEPSAEAGKGNYKFVVVATGSESRFTLPISVEIGESLPPRLTLKPELPSLRGGPNSDFEFKVAVKNDGGDDTTVRMDAGVPPGFRVKFTEQYGSQELTSFPLKVGEEKTISVKVNPPYSAQQGSYPVNLRAIGGKATAETRLTMEVSGEPKLQVAGVGERLSASAYVGEETAVDVVLTNNGSAPARNIKLTSTPPSGWQVTFQPERLDLLAPEKNETVKALITPAPKAIAGDYMVPVRAEAEGVSGSSDFRITVRTSTMWGIVGVLVIGAALVVLVAAMMRYGRR